MDAHPDPVSFYVVANDALPHSRPVLGEPTDETSSVGLILDSDRESHPSLDIVPPVHSFNRSLSYARAHTVFVSILNGTIASILSSTAVF
jgi:hypothetical protein